MNRTMHLDTANLAPCAGGVLSCIPARGVLMPVSTGAGPAQ
jgi:hypothetical protein